MTQRRSSRQIKQLHDAAQRRENGKRLPKKVVIDPTEIVCDTTEVREVCSDLEDLRKAVQRLHDAEDAEAAARLRGTFDEFFGTIPESNDAKKCLRSEMATINGKVKA